MPVLIALGIPFFAFAAAIVILGLSQTHSAQHGTQTSTGFWQFLSSGLLQTLFGQIAKAGRYIVSHFASAQLNVVAKWLLAMGTLTGGWFAVTADFAAAVERGFEWVIHRGDPRARAKAAKANTRALHAGRSAHHANVHARSVAHALNAYRARTNPRIHRLQHATTVVLPRDIGRVGAREDVLSRDLGKLRERTKSLEDGAVETWDWIRAHPLSGVTGVFTGAVAIALARMGFGFLRCRNWQQVGKRLTCGMGKWVLDLLEAIAVFGLALFSVLKPDVLAQEAVDLMDTVEPILSQILDN